MNHTWIERSSIMRALVVYESMFGNTQTIAEAIADGIGTYCMVETLEVGKAPGRIDADVDLLIAGGPTHQFGMSRASSRSDAAKRADQALVSRGIGIREWLDSVNHTAPVMAAAFDTRMSEPRWLHLVGSAAGKVEKRLKKLGFTVALPAEHFHVTGMQGPLQDGEIQRAREWGKQVAMAATSAEEFRQVA
jgi:flavodoxin